jgi:ketosteroid isomerase-like protein
MPTSVVQRFIRSINAHDSTGIIECLTDTHVLVDALGNEVRGRERIKQAWTEYFRMFPDYRIEIEDIFANGNQVAVFGSASATVAGKPDSAWEIPAAWKSHVKGGCIDRWQVFADTKVPLDRLAGIHSPSGQ